MSGKVVVVVKAKSAKTVVNAFYVVALKRLSLSWLTEDDPDAKIRFSAVDESACRSGVDLDREKEWSPVIWTSGDLGADSTQNSVITQHRSDSMRLRTIDGK